MSIILVTKSSNQRFSTLINQEATNGAWEEDTMLQQRPWGDENDGCPMLKKE
jgi:hypothetical protein